MEKNKLGLRYHVSLDMVSSTGRINSSFGAIGTAVAGRVGFPVSKTKRGNISDVYLQSGLGGFEADGFNLVSRTVFGFQSTKEQKIIWGIEGGYQIASKMSGLSGLVVRGKYGWGNDYGNINMFVGFRTADGQFTHEVGLGVDFGIGGKF